ncbi:hypothetical protein ACUXQE_000904 [Staphylococcus saprophyticus]
MTKAYDSVFNQTHETKIRSATNIGGIASSVNTF